MVDYIKEIIGFFIEKRLADSNNLSTELMMQCVRQDKSVFNEKRLDDLDPRYMHELQNMVMGAASNRMLDGKSRRNFIVSLEDELLRDIADKQKKSVLRKTYSIDDIDTHAKNLSAFGIREDLVRTLGHIKVVLDNNSVTITDSFDFKGKTASTTELLKNVASHITKNGVGAEVLTSIGSIFCKGENGKPTTSSIPIEIKFNVDKPSAHSQSIPNNQNSTNKIAQK